MMFVQLASQISRYFESQGIPTYGLTVVLEFQDMQSGARLDAALNHEFNKSLQWDKTEGVYQDFKVADINFVVRSPVHVRLLP